MHTLLDLSLATYILGYGRIVLAILSCYYMPTDYTTAALCYAISGLLDAVDGHAARYLKQCKLAVVLVYSFSITRPLPSFIYLSTCEILGTSNSFTLDCVKLCGHQAVHFETFITGCYCLPCSSVMLVCEVFVICCLQPPCLVLC